MSKVEIEVYSETVNSAIVRVPGRRFPGTVLQGDSLSILHANAKDLSNRLKELSIKDEDLLCSAQELQETLLNHLLHYQKVLTDNGIELPYINAAVPSDLVRLIVETPNAQ